MNRTIVTLSILLVTGVLLTSLKAQPETGYEFTTEKKLPTTPVKDQQRTGTCWSYTATSFLETELLRMGKPEIILSPMYFVRHTYTHKADRYVRFHGHNNFGQGSHAHNVMDVVREHGMVPESEYLGLNYGEDRHIHSELAAILKGIVDAVIKNPNRRLSTAWKPSYESVLDNYLGESPDEFEYKGRSFTPGSFAEWLEINPDDYVELTSYTHHPFYEAFVLEIPDNWAHSLFYNLPVDELMEVMDYALDNGYSISWDGDVSERGFVHSKGLAVLPQVEVEEMSDSEQARWSEMPENERLEEIYSFKEIVPEKEVTQQMRQETFDNYETTDDHLMHIVGTSRDQEGNLYYLTKNSWGSENHIYGGYLHMSESYVRLKTVAIMVHKDAIPGRIARKLGTR